MDFFRHASRLLSFHKPPGCKNIGSCMAVIKRFLRTPQARINTGFLRCFVLFEFYRPRRLRRQIVKNAVDTLHLRSNPRRNFLQQGKRHIRNGSSHRIHRINRAEDHRPFERTDIFPNAHGFKIRNDRKILPNLAFQPRFCKFFPHPIPEPPPGDRA